MIRIPEYVDDPVYMELAKLCRQAGFPIKYRKLPDNVGGLSQNFKGIEMPNEHIFGSDAEAALALGHELAHLIVETVYNSRRRDDDDIVRNTIIEADCNRMGVAFFRLAQSIVTCKYVKGLQKQPGYDPLDTEINLCRSDLPPIATMKTNNKA